MSEDRPVLVQERLEFLGLPLDRVNTEQAVAAIEGFIERWDGGVPRVGFTLNAQGVYLATRDPEFARLIRAADLVRADGMSVVWASRLLGQPIPERLCTTDFVRPLAARCAERGYSMYLLGATEEDVEGAAAALTAEFPELKIVGTHHGYLKEPELNQRVVDEINERSPSILLVGMGRPLQEKWILENKDKLRIPVCLACGGLFKFLAAAERRAPIWMRKAGLEWVYRFMLDPRRMWKRYVVGNSVFVYLVCKARLTRKPPM